MQQCKGLGWPLLGRSKVKGQGCRSRCKVHVQAFNTRVPRSKPIQSTYQSQIVTVVGFRCNMCSSCPDVRSIVIASVLGQFSTRIPRRSVQQQTHTLACMHVHMRARTSLHNFGLHLPATVHTLQSTTHQYMWLFPWLTSRIEWIGCPFPLHLSLVQWMMWVATGGHGTPPAQLH